MTRWTRRTVLTAATVTAAAAGRAERTASSPRPGHLVVVGGHPDDPESGCGGLMAKARERDIGVTALYVTRGERGIPGAGQPEAGRLREAEARAAGRVLNVEPMFHGDIDGAVRTDEAARNAFAQRLRALAPDVVAVHWPLDTHADHRAAFELTLAAWVKDRQAFALVFYEVLSGWQTQGFAPTSYVPIASVLERKRKALFAHVSQDPAGLWERHQRMQEQRGLERGVAAAEAYIHHAPSRALPAWWPDDEGVVPKSAKP